MLTYSISHVLLQYDCYRCYNKQFEAQLHSQQLELQHLKETVTDVKVALQSEVEAVTTDLRTDIERLKELIDDVSATSAAEQELATLRVDDICEQVCYVAFVCVTFMSATFRAVWALLYQLRTYCASCYSCQLSSVFNRVNSFALLITCHRARYFYLNHSSEVNLYQQQILLSVFLHNINRIYR
jgi:hypothetical protein